MRVREWAVTALTVLPVLALLGLCWALWGDEDLVVDQFVGYRGLWPNLTLMLQWITDYGNYLLFGAYAGILIAANLRDDPVLRRFAQSYIVALILTLIAVYLLKYYVGRARPYVASGLEVLELLNAYRSFPSGHTTEAVLSVIPLALLAGKKRYAVGFGCFAAVIAFTRIFLGVHYLTDILGGVALGTVAALFAWWLFRRAEKHEAEIS